MLFDSESIAALHSVQSQQPLLPQDSQSLPLQASQ